MTAITTGRTGLNTVFAGVWWIVRKVAWGIVGLVGIALLIALVGAIIVGLPVGITHLLPDDIVKHVFIYVFPPHDYGGGIHVGGPAHRFLQHDGVLSFSDRLGAGWILIIGTIIATAVLLGISWVASTLFGGGSSNSS